MDVTAGEAAGVLTVGRGPDGGLCRIELRAGVHGSMTAGLADALATAVTIGLQHGVPAAAFTDVLRRAALGGTAAEHTALLVETFAATNSADTSRPAMRR
ncbi:hypothetical protein ACQP2P_16295 [Dactylosporangium sp. CA-139114]|uniref:hypothetical protein n=1 Tax=Dactylosporangium sp. CA-139114 TaxID=3239931 RepID=UPI003D95C28E